MLFHSPPALRLLSAMDSSKKRQKKSSGKSSTPQSGFQSALATCIKSNDVSAALALYETAYSHNIRLTPSNFNSLLYLCSSSSPNPSISAIESGFRIFQRMLSAGIAPTEATLTAAARLAAAKPDADLAFRLVKDNAAKYGVAVRLRTYAPALFAFCANEEPGKAYEVEEEMVANGIPPDEAEIAGLLQVSAKAGRCERVYAYLHKLRNAVKCVKEETAGVIERWFKSEAAMEVVGGLEEDENSVREVILKNGGGWYGIGWLGKGGWEVSRTRIEANGVCGCCEERLVCVDASDEETEGFAELICRLAIEREAKSGFCEFKEWLDNHGEYEAIIDGANIAFFQQNFADGGFSLPQLNQVVKEFHQRSQNKWPLVILHSKRVQALMEIPSNRELLEEWRAQDALYTAPIGSNDDWYWLYSGVKLKCLLVTNDEMRDHIFELLGSNFFSKWKERHQVRYDFVKGKLRLQMPPLYSVTIQESGKGSWHVPIEGDCSTEQSRTWLCVNRPKICEDFDAPVGLNAHFNGWNTGSVQTAKFDEENTNQNFPVRSQICVENLVVTGKSKK